MERLADPCDLFHPLKSVKREGGWSALKLGTVQLNLLCVSHLPLRANKASSPPTEPVDRGGGTGGVVVVGWWWMVVGGGALDVLRWRAATPRGVLMNARQSQLGVK